MDFNHYFSSIEENKIIKISFLNTKINNYFLIKINAILSFFKFPHQIIQKNKKLNFIEIKNFIFYLIVKNEYRIKDYSINYSDKLIEFMIVKK